jgi:hypothetical protein
LPNASSTLRLGAFARDLSSFPAFSARLAQNGPLDTRDMPRITRCQDRLVRRRCARGPWQKLSTESHSGSQNDQCPAAQRHEAKICVLLRPSVDESPRREPREHAPQADSPQLRDDTKGSKRESELEAGRPRISRIARMGRNPTPLSVISVPSVVKIFVVQIFGVPGSVVLDASWTQLGRKRCRVLRPKISRVTTST